MDYFWFKALHIVAVITWIGGMLVASVTVAAVTTSRIVPPARTDLIAYVRRWDRRVTSPAMLLVWGFGLVLAMQGSWLPQRWLVIKIVIVLFLSGLHGMLSGRLRRLAADDGVGAAAMKRAPFAILTAVVAIVVLVVVKPF